MPRFDQKTPGNMGLLLWNASTGAGSALNDWEPWTSAMPPLAVPAPPDLDLATTAAHLMREAEALETAIRTAREAIPEAQGRKGQRAELAQAARACRRTICALSRVRARSSGKKNPGSTGGQPATRARRGLSQRT
jgi:hypothetical protein